uniref:Major facilitator superfamily (MFS) profile domain-containing protein n=1 Tax=Aegilops tauschii subsp. strangulata TaxID=200361 RepID=A0A453L9U7_AEGTS
MGKPRASGDVRTGALASGSGGATAPLLPRNDRKADAKVQGGSLFMVLLSTAVAVCGAFEFGTCVGYSAPTQSGIERELGLSMAEFAIFGSVLTIGAMIGAVTSGRLADSLGRKMTMRIAAIICVFGWLSIHFAKGATMLYFGRTLLGFCTGVLSYVVPVFIAEIAPKDLRGGLATSNQLLIVCGSSTTYITGALVTWRNLVLVGIVPSVLLLVGLLFIPESPRWLAQAGREEEFHASLQRLRGENADISEEAIEIKEYIESLQSFPRARIQDLFLSRNIYAVIVGVGLMIFQQLGGINGVGFYASFIFSSAGFSGKLGTILIGIVQVSASGTFLGCFLAGISFYLKAHGLFLEWVPALALSGILVYIGAYSIGMGPVPWVIMSEIFAINIKAIGGSLVTLISWLGSFAVSYSFNFLMDWSSAGGRSSCSLRRAWSLYCSWQG